MRIKTFVYQIQARLGASAGLSVKRTHIYELIAAAQGLSSYAALVTNGLLCPLPSEPLRIRFAQLNPTSVETRARQLGYSAASAARLQEELLSQLQVEQLGVVPLQLILDELLSGSFELSEEPKRDEAYYEALDAVSEDDGLLNAFWEEEMDEPLNLRSEWILDALRFAAERGDGRAHFAMALLTYGYANCDEDDEDDEDVVSDIQRGVYWYQREKKGEVLVGVEKEWANDYRDYLQERTEEDAARAWRQISAKAHLEKAAVLGVDDALLVLASRYRDDRFFDLEHVNVTADPLWIADLADRVGRYEWGLAWKVLAAEQGNIAAMKELIRCEHREDAMQTWTWFYLAMLHEVDLTQCNYRAIHEDGSAYDDGVGGAMFAEGEDGITLPAIDEDTKVRAEGLAQLLFQAHADSYNMVRWRCR